MGTQSPKIKISQGVNYSGDLNEKGQPHGKGQIVLSSKSDKQLTKKFKGQFKQGQPIYGIAEIGNLVYEGQINERSFSGKGKLIDKQKNTIYEGMFSSGNLTQGTIRKDKKYNCNGKFQLYADENEHQIKCLHGQQGSFHNCQTNQKWSGSFYRGEISGKGKYSTNLGLTYDGEFNCGKFFGKGTYFNSSENVCQIDGNFKSDKLFDRQEKVMFQDGSVYCGEMKNSEYLGTQCQYKQSNGIVYKGPIHQGQFTGQCEISYPKTSKVQHYRGQVHEGKYNGLGILEYRNGVVIKGYFYDNVKNGPCILVYGNRIFKGLFMMDRLIGELQQIHKNSI